MEVLPHTFCSFRADRQQFWFVMSIRFAVFFFSQEIPKFSQKCKNQNININSKDGRVKWRCCWIVEPKKGKYEDEELISYLAIWILKLKYFGEMMLCEWVCWATEIESTKMLTLWDCKQIWAYLTETDYPYLSILANIDIQNWMITNDKRE